MDQVKCHLEIPVVKGLKDAEMTVGRHALLSCEGNWNKSFDFTKAQIKLEENQKYLVKVLKAEARSVSNFDVDLTLYVAGQAQLPDMILTDGANEISLGQQNFQVQTVLESAQDGKPPKPYSYLFPLKLEWPALYFILVGVVLALLITGLILQLRRAARYSRLIADLQKYNSSLSPDLQFYKSLRQAEKMQYPIDELEKAFRLYVLRLFNVPMFVLNNRQIINFMKKRKPIYKVERTQLQKILSEFEEIQKNKIELSAPLKSELVSKMYRFVDRTQQIGKVQ